MSEIPNIFDRKNIGKNLLAKTYHSVDFITQLILDDLAQRLETISRPFNKALILAPDIAQLPNKLKSAQSQFVPDKISTLLPGTNSPIDPENLILPENNYDLIISLFDVGITNDVPGFLTQIQQYLAPDGLFFAAFIGGNSLNQLRTAWLEADAKHLGGALARVAPFIDIKDAGSLLQRAGFKIPVADKETISLRYASPLHLMHELKHLGASNPLANRKSQLLTPKHLASAISAYENIASDQDGRIRVTLEIIWMSGWAHDENQQKPLKPGSAQISLTKILGKK